jgi:hypothetical protein
MAQKRVVLPLIKTTTTTTMMMMMMPISTFVKITVCYILNYFINTLILLYVYFFNKAVSKVTACEWHT